MKVLGLDPGFASVGWAVFNVTSEDLHFVAGGVFHTKKNVEKRAVLACEDNFVRARELAQMLRNAIDAFEIRAVCAEAMSFPRHASNAAKMALCWGVIADVTLHLDLPVMQPTPQKIKKTLCGAISASKEEVEAVVKDRGVREPISLKKGEREHFYDACAAVLACRDSEVFRLLRKVA